MTYNPLWGVGVVGTTGNIAAAVRYLVGKVTTTNAAHTTLIEIPLATVGRVMLVEANVIGKTDASALTSFRLTASFKNVAGVVSQVGAVNIVHAHSDTALNTADVDLTVSGTSVIVRVQGVAATNVTWFGRVMTTED